MEEVKIYTTSTCLYCRQAKEYMQKKGIKYTEYDVTKNQDALKEMVKISGARSVPVITACEEVMIGFDPARLEQMISCIQHRTAL
ncbi:MAG: glutaredoxin family protein [Nitrospirae bacterium]|nr:glutaredoxin family protein [Nitrospirota bacterium]